MDALSVFSYYRSEGGLSGLKLWLILGPLVCLAQGVLINKEPRNGQADTGERFQIGGVVVNSETGMPVRRALVRVDGGSPGSQAKMTDETGRFEFGSLEAGRYTIEAWRPGYDESSTTRRRGATIQVGPSVKDLRLQLVPLAVITGRVIAAEGDPIGGITVEALHSRISEGVRLATVAASAVTDSRGEFRLAELSPGSYLLKTVGMWSSGASLVELPSSPRVLDSFGALFYQQTPDRALATTIRLKPGESFQAGFTLTPAPGFRIRGSVQGVKLLEKVRLHLLLENGESMASRSVITLGSGRFEIFDAPAGNYIVEALAQSSTGGEERIARSPVQVGQRNVDGVRLAFAEGVPVEVRVSGSAGGQVGTVSPERRRSIETVYTAIRLVPADATLRGQRQRTVFLNPARQSAEVERIPAGRYHVHVQGNRSGLSSGAYVESIRSGATDVLSEGLTLQEGVAAAPLEVVLGAGGGTISGTVRGAGSCESDVTVLFLRAAGSGIIPQTTRALPPDCRFTAGGLAAGDYLLWAWSGDEVIEYHNPAALAGWKDIAVEVRVSNGAKAEQVEVKLLEGEQP